MSPKTYKLFVTLFIVYTLVICAVVGIFFGFAVYLDHYNRDYIKTTGVISEIVGDQYTTDHQTFVTYSVDGTSYTSQLNVISTEDRVGKEVSIFYLPSDPKSIHDDTTLLSAGFKLISIFAWGVIIGSTVIGLIVLRIIKRKVRINE